MSTKDLKCEPHEVNDNWWWYEEPQGICVVYNNEIRGSAVVDIPWKSIRAAIKRLDRKS